jgi:bacteriorhodopsin
MGLIELSTNQYQLVYNMFSLVIAGMFASAVFFIFMRQQVAPAYRTAVAVSTVVVLIAGYHYLRIFDSWENSFELVDGALVQVGLGFNEGYRYVDWLLTVPLLLTELVLVLRMGRDRTRRLLLQLVPASIAMILLGWPGELSDPDSTARTVWGVLSTIPFVFIVWVLFTQLGRSLGRQPAGVDRIVDRMRWLLLITWGVYPLAYIAPSVISDEATAEVVRQVGYSVADLLAKPLFGLLVVAIAVIKTRADAAADDPSGDTGRIPVSTN